MLAERIIAGGFTAAKSISADRSRCLRMRFSGNSCSLCTAQCRTGAIKIDEDVHILANNCSECMVCVSECPSDCFETPGPDFYSLIGRLRNIQASVRLPVLGCKASTGVACHEKTFCFGFLSEEHLIALAVFLKDALQIDMTECGDCKNGFILEALGERIESVEAKTAIKISDRIKLVHNKADLVFQEMPYDRRGFFKALRNTTFTKAAGLFDNYDSGEKVLSYSAKKLPLKRELLNRALRALPEKPQRSLLENYYYMVDVDEDCDNCFSCIGMCPTGALKIENSGDKRELFFSSSLCNACGLCESFCKKRSVRIEKGFCGENPFKFGNAKKEVSCTG